MNVFQTYLKVKQGIVDCLECSDNQAVLESTISFSFGFCNNVKASLCLLQKLRCYKRICLHTLFKWNGKNICFARLSRNYDSSVLFAYFLRKWPRNGHDCCCHTSTYFLHVLFKNYFVFLFLFKKIWKIGFLSFFCIWNFLPLLREIIFVW